MHKIRHKSLHKDAVTSWAMHVVVKKKHETDVMKFTNRRLENKCDFLTSSLPLASQMLASISIYIDH